jgi:hypothetical protein
MAVYADDGTGFAALQFQNHIFTFKTGNLLFTIPMYPRIHAVVAKPIIDKLHDPVFFEVRALYGDELLHQF